MKLALNKREIIYTIAKDAELDYNFCERFYEKREFSIVFLNENESKRKFDSDSNAIEVESPKEFFKAIDNALENKKVVVAIINIAIPEETLIEYEKCLVKMGNVHPLTDQEVEKIEFEIS